MTVGQISRLPRPVHDAYAWQERGACSEGDPTVFFHPDGERGPARRLRELKALAVCAGCGVVDDCRRHALSVREPFGVWGGLTERERELIHSRSGSAATASAGAADAGLDAPRGAGHAC